MYSTDSIDEQLVRLLGRDAKQSNEELAKQLNISSATVRRRIKKLTQNGVLHIVGVVDPGDFGLPQTSVIAIAVTPDKLESTIEELNKRPEIRWVTISTGRYDIIAGARFSSMDSLSDFKLKVLSKMDGVKDIEMFLVLKHTKGGLVTLP
jgi:Lrp/AsnC family transcriptional regulator for asnA, asnC and gidA